MMEEETESHQDGDSSQEKDDGSQTKEISISKNETQDV
jgi:hypothetical protein